MLTKKHLMRTILEPSRCKSANLWKRDYCCSYPVCVSHTVWRMCIASGQKQLLAFVFLNSSEFQDCVFFINFHLLINCFSLSSAAFFRLDPTWRMSTCALSRSSRTPLCSLKITMREKSSKTKHISTYPVTSQSLSQWVRNQGKLNIKHISTCRYTLWHHRQLRTVFLDGRGKSFGSGSARRLTLPTGKSNSIGDHKHFVIIS